MAASERSATSIDKDSPVPIYYQLKSLLEEGIRRGELRPGDRIPTEEELCARYEISRTPVRQALRELAREGLIRRFKRRGSFVSQLVPPHAEPVTLRALVVDRRWDYPLRAAAGRLNAGPGGRRVELKVEEVPLPRLRQTLISAVARGEAPDIALLDSVWVAEFVAGDYLLPLDRVDPEWLKGEYEAAFYPAFAELGIYEGVCYAIPSEVDLVLLWHRRDLFEAEGLRGPRTWEELVRSGLHFARPPVRERYGLGPHSLAFPAGAAAGEATTYHLLPFLWSVGADLLADGVVALDSAKTRRALSFLHSLVHEHGVVSPEAVDYGWHTPLDLFARGEVAMAVGGSYAGALIRAEAHWGADGFRRRAGFGLIPAGPGGHRTTAAGGMLYGIFRQSRAPELALALLRQAVGVDIMESFCRATSHNPPRSDVARRLTVDGDWFLSQTADLLPGARIRPRHSQYARVSQIFRDLVADVLSGRKEMDPAVTQAAHAIAAVTGLPVA